MNKFDNKEYILSTFKDKVIIMYCISERLRDDKRFMRKLIQIDARAFKVASPRLRNDKSIVISAIQSNVWMFSYASPKMRLNEEVLAAAQAKSKSTVAYINRRDQHIKVQSNS